MQTLCNNFEQNVVKGQNIWNNVRKIIQDHLFIQDPLFMTPLLFTYSVLMQVKVNCV